MATRKKGRRAAKSAAATSSLTKDFAKMGSKIWLAGVGALVRSRTEGPKLFERLVAEGSAAQERTRVTTEHSIKNALDEMRGAIDTGVKGARDKASDAWDNIEEIFQARVHKALEKLGVPTAKEVRLLTSKVEELTRSVQALAGDKKKRGAKPASKTRASRATSALQNGAL